jgi:PAS domain S-box-containing protein
MSEDNHTANSLTNYADKNVKKSKFDKAFYENLFHLSPEAIAIVDSECNVIKVNKKFLELFEFELEEVREKNVTDLIVPDNFKDESKSILTKLHIDEEIQWETLRQSKNGKPIHVSLIGKMTEFSTGDIVIYLIYKNITQSKNTEFELLKERNQLLSLMNNVPDTIYFKDTNSKFTKINKAQAEVLGLSNPIEAIGKTDFDFFEHAQSAYDDEQEIIRTGRPLINKEQKIKTADGKYKWVYDTKVPIFDDEKNVIGIVGVTRDISELKSAQDKLTRTAEQLENLNRSKDKFFSIIAHDLKNPMWTVLGYADMIYEQNQNLSEDEKSELIGQMIVSIKNTYQLLDNLLNWSRAEDGRMEFNPVRLDLTEVINKNVDLLKSLLENKSIELIKDIENSISVYADENMLNAILRNLLTNGIKFSKINGKLKISARKDEKEVQIRIKDDGVGIAQDKIDQILNTSSYLSTEGTSKEKGTGLGLELCKDFIKRHNGELKIESSENYGSEFIVILPV